MPGSYGHIIIFRKGERIDRRVHKSHFSEAVALVKKLKDQGVKAHFVWLTQGSMYPPAHQIKEKRNEGMLWCPWCRAWRWFSVPKYKRGEPYGTDQWFLNSYFRQGIKCCQWCHITIYDWYVGVSNGIFAEVRASRRRRRRKRRTG